MSDNRTAVVGLIQMSCSAEPEQNLQKALDRIAEAAKQGAQIVCLQELFRSQYFCQQENPELFDLAEPIPGPSSGALGKAAAQHGVVIVGSLFERRAAGVYHNTATVHRSDGTLAGIYRKMHIPDDPLYYEKYYFTPGDLGFQVFETRFGRVGTLVCWDQWYPEAARLTALRGADLLVYPTAIGWHPAEKQEWGERQREAWRTVQRSHAVANNLYVAAVNRVGVEQPLADSPDKPGDYRGIEFWGSSFVAGPMGETLAEAGEGEQLLLAECDFGKIEQVRRNWPFLRDRRIDAYGEIQRRVAD